MTVSDVYHAWRAKHLESGHRVEPVARLFDLGPTRWGAFDGDWREVSAFVTVPLRPEMDREVPARER